jgi:hypothetical protein
VTTLFDQIIDKEVQHLISTLSFEAKLKLRRCSWSEAEIRRARGSLLDRWLAPSVIIALDQTLLTGLQLLQ